MDSTAYKACNMYYLVGCLQKRFANLYSREKTGNETSVHEYEECYDEEV